MWRWRLVQRGRSEAKAAANSWEERSLCLSSLIWAWSGSEEERLICKRVEYDSRTGTGAPYPSLRFSLSLLLRTRSRLSPPRLLIGAIGPSAMLTKGSPFWFMVPQDGLVLRSLPSEIPWLRVWLHRGENLFRYTELQLFCRYSLHHIKMITRHRGCDMMKLCSCPRDEKRGPFYIKGNGDKMKRKEKKKTWKELSIFPEYWSTQ